MRPARTSDVAGGEGALLGWAGHPRGNLRSPPGVSSERIKGERCDSPVNSRARVTGKSLEGLCSATISFQEMLPGSEVSTTKGSLIRRPIGQGRWAEGSKGARAPRLGPHLIGELRPGLAVLSFQMEKERELCGF